MVMDVSVVVPSYRSEGTIAQCLQSILSQTTAARHEVIVCDSSPGDEVQNIVAGYPVKFVKITKKTPPGIARNIGAEKAQGELLVFVDADMVLESGTLEEIWKCYQQGHEVFSIALELGKGRQSLSSYIEQYLFFCEQQSGRKTGERTYLPSTVFIIKRETFSSFGGFKSYWRGEDTEFTERIRRMGKRLMFFSQLVARRNQNIPFREIANKNFKCGIHWGRKHFLKESGFKKLMLVFFSPLLSLFKSARIVCRNAIYNKGTDRWLSILLSPVLFLLGFWWIAGLIAGLFLGVSDKEERGDSCQYI